jgi:hypothetical protein
MRDSRRICLFVLAAVLAVAGFIWLGATYLWMSYQEESISRASLVAADEDINVNCGSAEGPVRRCDVTFVHYGLKASVSVPAGDYGSASFRLKHSAGGRRGIFVEPESDWLKTTLDVSSVPKSAAVEWIRRLSETSISAAQNQLGAELKQARAKRAIRESY